MKPQEGVYKLKHTEDGEILECHCCCCPVPTRFLSWMHPEKMGTTGRQICFICELTGIHVVVDASRTGWAENMNAQNFDTRKDIAVVGNYLASLIGEKLKDHDLETFDKMEEDGFVK